MLRLRLTCSAAVLALGLAACGDNEEAETDMTGDTVDAGMEESAMDEGEAGRNAGADAPGTQENRAANGGSGQGQPMRAGSEPSEEVKQIVSEARTCQTEQGEDEYEAEEQSEGQDEASYNAQVSQSYLEANAGRECVFELPSGLQFTIVNAVEDAPSPTSGELVRVDYEGRLVSGETFDSSYERGQPAMFPSDRLISGWVEALPLMRVGEEWTLFIPPELGYGQRGTPGGPIGPNQALIFKIELLGLPGREQGRQGGMSGDMSEDAAGETSSDGGDSGSDSDEG
ncbi:MAG: FKBP-type peptidyl-prolyl cis-trans isomerase [Oceanicaulis sp.]